MKWRPGFCEALAGRVVSDVLELSVPPAGFHAPRERRSITELHGEAKELAMTGKLSRPNADRANLAGSNAPGLLVADERTRASQKAVGTLRRHKEARRSERLAEIRAQIANGTLVVRHMTAEQREAESQAARRAQNESGAGLL